MHRGTMNVSVLKETPGQPFLGWVCPAIEVAMAGQRVQLTLYLVQRTAWLWGQRHG